MKTENATAATRLQPLVGRRCVDCPFNDGLTEEASVAQNYGCLPTASEMIQRFDDSGMAISCHDHGTIACRGLSRSRDVSQAKVLDYADWYRGG